MKKLPDMVFSKNKVNILVIRTGNALELCLKTPDGKVVAGAVYIIIKADGEEITGSLDEKGQATINAENLNGAMIEFKGRRFKVADD